MNRRRPKLVLYTKPGCHLCDEAREALTSVGSYADVKERDITENPDLTREFGTRVPVLAETGSDKAIDWPFGPADIERLVRN